MKVLAARAEKSNYEGCNKRGKHMSAFNNLHGFCAQNAEMIATVDNERGLAGELSKSADNFMFGRRDYGKTRAIDLYNAAYEQVRARRTKIVLNCFAAGTATVLSVVAVGATSRLWRGLVAGLDVGTVEHVMLGTVTTAAAFILTALAVSACVNTSARRFHKQFNKTGQVEKDAPNDAAVARAARRLLETYVKDADVAKSIPFGQGLSEAEPLRLKRAISQQETHGDRDIGDLLRVKSHPHHAATVLANPEKCNRQGYIRYVAHRLGDLAMRNPHAPLKTGDVEHIYGAYADMWRLKQQGRELRALAGGAFAAFAPTALVVAEATHAIGNTPLAAFLRDYKTPVAYALFAAGIVCAAPYAIAYVRSARTHGWDIYGRMKESSRASDAPVDAAVSVAARREVDKRLALYVAKNNLTL